MFKKFTDSILSPMVGFSSACFLGGAIYAKSKYHDYQLDSKLNEQFRQVYGKELIFPTSNTSIVQNFEDGIKEYKRVTPLLIDHKEDVRQFLHEVAAKQQFEILQEKIIQNLREGKSSDILFFKMNNCLSRDYREKLNFSLMEDCLIKEFKKHGQEIRIYHFRYANNEFRVEYDLIVK
jgi:hypothetical protein